MSKTEPKEPLKYFKTETEENKAAMYNTIYFKDADGDVWFYEASKFKFDLDIDCKYRIKPKKEEVWERCSLMPEAICNNLRKEKKCPAEKKD